MSARVVGPLLIASLSMGCTGSDGPAAPDAAMGLEAHDAGPSESRRQSSRRMATGMGARTESSISAAGGASSGNSPNVASMGRAASGSSSGAAEGESSPAPGSSATPAPSDADSGSQASAPEGGQSADRSEAGQGDESAGETGQQQSAQEGSDPAMEDADGAAEESATMNVDGAGDSQAAASDQAMTDDGATMPAQDTMREAMAMEDSEPGTETSEQASMTMADASSAAGSPMVCASYFEGIAGANAPGAEVVPVPGSWGQLPELLRPLPAGAELCGTYSVGGLVEFVAIASPADGQVLRTHYDPILTGVGCTFLLETPVADAVSYSYNCPPAVGGVVSIATSAGDIGVYLLSYVAP